MVAGRTQIVATVQGPLTSLAHYCCCLLARAVAVVVAIAAVAAAADCCRLRLEGHVLLGARARVQHLLVS